MGGWIGLGERWRSVMDEAWRLKTNIERPTSNVQHRSLKTGESI
jgi:hypothetical protein